MSETIAELYEKLLDRADYDRDRAKNEGRHRLTDEKLARIGLHRVKRNGVTYIESMEE